MAGLNHWWSIRLKADGTKICPFSNSCEIGFFKSVPSPTPTKLYRQAGRVHQGFTWIKGRATLSLLRRVETAAVRGFRLFGCVGAVAVGMVGGHAAPFPHTASRQPRK